MPESKSPDGEEVVVEINLPAGAETPKKPEGTGVFTLMGGPKLMPSAKPGEPIEADALERYLEMPGTGVTAAFQDQKVVAARSADVVAAVQAAGLTGAEEEEE